MAISRTATITFMYHYQKSLHVFLWKIYLPHFIIGLETDNEKLRGWGENIHRVEDEDSCQC